MSLVVVEAAMVVADASKRDEIIASSAPIQQATRDEEPGCLVYCLAADPVRDDLIQVVELWESEDALHAHLEHPNYVALFQLATSAGLRSVVATKHRVDRTAPVYGPDLVPTGRFD